MAKLRAENLSDTLIDNIVKVIDEWPTKKLTWDLLISALTSAGLPEYTRQALDRQPKIKLAYHSRKTTLREVRTSATALPTGASKADVRVVALDATVKRLKLENDYLLERFMRWLYNATNAGLSTDDLDKPLPYMDRNAMPDDEVIRPAVAKRNRNSPAPSEGRRR